jgi:hypothetical protein
MMRAAAIRGRYARARRRALTLFEIVIAVGLIVMLTAAMLLFFWQTGEIRRQAARTSDKSQVARQVLDGIAAELRGCVGLEQIGFPVEQRLVGDRRGITFLTTAAPDQSQYRFYRESDELPPAQHDLRLITYSLWVDENQTTEEGNPIVGGILRIEKKTLNQMVVEEDDPLDQRTDLWSHELGYLEFRYYDGVEWDTKWDITEGNSLPQLIQITVGFDTITMDELEDADLQGDALTRQPEFNPNRYSTIVKIPTADRFFSSRIQRVGKQMSEQMGVGGTP